MFPQVDERFILVVLSGNISAHAAEIVQLLLHLLCWCLYVGLDSLEVFLMVHLRPGISHNLNIFGKEIVSVLAVRLDSANTRGFEGTYKAKKGWELGGCQQSFLNKTARAKLTVFFFAKSPEAPRTTMTVLSLSSIVLDTEKRY